MSERSTQAGQRRIAALSAKLAASLREQKEALEREAATADILRALSRSSSDPQPVFDAIVKHAHRLCGADFSVVYRYDGSLIHVVADKQVSAKASRALRSLYPMAPTKKHIVGRAVLEGRTHHSADMPRDPRFPANRRRVNAFSKLVPYRAGLALPLLQNGAVVGAIAVARLEPRPFSKREIRLLETFADQALIAIRNAAQFREIEARNAELDQSLRHQTATSEVLRVVSRSMADAKPVFDAILAAALRLFDGFDATVWIVDKEDLIAVARDGPTVRRRIGDRFPIARTHIARVVILGRKALRVDDVRAAKHIPESAKRWLLANRRNAVLWAPLLRAGAAIGALSVSRAQPFPFTDKHAALLENFADQAVIAIENARLFKELEEKNRVLAAALNQQTATSEILRSMSTSLNDVQPVFDTIVQSGLRLLGGYSATLSLLRGGELHLAAYTSTGAAGDGSITRFFPIVPAVLPPAERSLRERRPQAIENVETAGVSRSIRATARARGWRSALFVPMIRGSEALGILTVTRREPGPFAADEVALLETFAAQAVIAIENVRLFNETKDALERQTATAEILRVISQSQTDTQPVFDAIVRSAVRLCAGSFGSMLRIDGDTIHLGAYYNLSPQAHKLLPSRFPAPLSEHSLVALAARTGEVVHSPDVGSDARSSKHAVPRTLGIRAQLTVPLRKDGKTLALLNVARDTPGRFSDAQIEVLKTFADQAAIAIENVRLFNETKEALEQQTATTDVLSVISNSPTEIQPVLDAVAATAARLCEARDAIIQLREGEVLRFAAHYGTIPNLPQGGTRAISREMATGRAVLEGRQIHVHDLQAEKKQFPLGSAVAKEFGYRTILVTPLMREGKAIGTILIRRTEVRPFSDKHLALVRTFAGQAVIAIENVRLFNETRKALERQTATSEVLAAISGAQTDAGPVFDAIARNAHRLCGAVFCNVLRYDGDMLHIAATHGFSPEALAKVREKYPVKADDPSVLSGRVILSGKIEHIDDVLADPTYDHDHAAAGGWRRMLGVPMLRDGAPLGVIGVAWRDTGKTPDHQVELLKTFAAQAVIAIENVRLFNETKDALERQTATSQILQVISSTPADTQPVFEAIVNNAQRIIAARSTALLLRGEKEFFVAAHSIFGLEEMPAQLRRVPLDRDSNFPSRVILDREVLHIPDWLADDIPPHEKRVAEAFGFRSGVQVPLLRKGEGIGALVVTRATKGPFSDKEIALLQSFADQAVIAIENVRLFNETKESLEQQTAISEVLRVISNSPTDVQPVLDAVAARAARICEAFDAIILLREGNHIRHVAHFGDIPPGTGLEPGKSVPLGRDMAAGRAILDGTPVHIEDLTAMPPEEWRRALELQKSGQHRTMLAVPLMREDRALGAINLRRMEVRPFTDKQIALLKTFADQAAIAIENVRLFNETREALERQTATADILKVISSSPSDVQPVFAAIARSAVKLCDGLFANVFRYEGGLVHYVASDGLSQEGISIQKQKYPMRPDRSSVSGRVILGKSVERMEDSLSDTAYDRSFIAAAGGPRRMLGVPMLRAGEPRGAIVVAWASPGPISPAHEQLLTTFADQAAIAIENVRLFNETKEALERQTATAEILKVISSSTTDTQPVLDAITQTAHRLFAVSEAGIALLRNGRIELAATCGLDPARVKAMRSSFPRPLGLDSMVNQVVERGVLVHLADTESPEVPEITRRNTAAMGVRAVLGVPMVRDGEPAGAIFLSRLEPGAFSGKQVALLQTFAAQAVIAIENARLFNETKEALERQTATSDILRVIAGTPTDTQPVFDAIVQSAQRLMSAKSAILLLRRDTDFFVAAYSFPGIEKLPAEVRTAPLDPAKNFPSQVMLERKIVHIPDWEAEGVLEFERFVAKAYGIGSGLQVPLVRKGEGMGALAVARQTKGPFSDKEIALLQSFADQAVIAIENVRLFKELQARTEALAKSVDQLTALGEVGQAISSTLDLETVLKTIVSRAVQLTGLDSGAIYEYDEGAELFKLQAAEKFEPELMVAVRRAPIRKGDGATGRIAVTLEAEQVPDIEEDSYRGTRKNVLVRAGYRAILAVPLLSENHLLGALQVFRRSPGPFAPEVVELLKTFATQSALAIQNARLFREIAEKGSELEVASRHKSQFLASMSHELRTPLNAILGFNEMILDQVYGEIAPDVKAPLENMQASGKHLLRLINNVLDLAKIEAGRMELALADYSAQDTVASVRATLAPLAAEKGLQFLASVPDDLPLVYGDGGRIAQCLLNLAGNSLKFTKQGSVEISVALANGSMRYTVADTGIGIPPDKIGSLFTEFRQTDATIASEYGGTGLGLSITKKFIEMHGGRIWVQSEPGKGSAFIFEVPLRAGAGS